MIVRPRVRDRCFGPQPWPALLLSEQARREPQRDPGNHYRGAISQPHSICDESEETWGGMSPHHPTRGLGASWASWRSTGRSRPPKWILGIFEVRKKHASGTPFSVFLSDCRAPQSRGARENFPPPLSTGLCREGAPGSPVSGSATEQSDTMNNSSSRMTQQLIDPTIRSW